MKKLVSLVLALCMLFTLCACGQKASAPAEEAPAAEAPAAEAEAPAAEAETPAEELKTGVLKLGCLADLTASGAVLGMACYNGNQLAIKDINEAGGVQIGDTVYTLELVAYDTKSDPNEAIAGMQRMVEVDNVSAIMGPPISNIGLACAPYTDEYGVPFLGMFGDPRCMLGENLDTLNKYMFLMQPSADQTGIQSVSYLVEVLGCEYPGILLAQDHAYEVSQINGALEYLDAKGIKYEIEYCNQNDLDFKTQLTNLMNKGCDCLLNANPTQPLTISTNQKYQLGWNVPQSCSLDFSYPFATLVADEATASNIYFVQNLPSDAEGFKEIDAKCQAAFGTEATIKTVLAYDEILIAVAAAQKAGSIDREAIRDALENISGVETVVTDNFSIDPATHMPLGLNVCIMKIEQGEYSMAEWWNPDFLK